MLANKLTGHIEPPASFIVLRKYKGYANPTWSASNNHENTRSETKTLSEQLTFRKDHAASANSSNN